MAIQFGYSGFPAWLCWLGWQLILAGYAGWLHFFGGVAMLANLAYYAGYCSWLAHWICRRFAAYDGWICWLWCLDLLGVYGDWLCWLNWL